MKLNILYLFLVFFLISEESISQELSAWNLDFEEWDDSTLIDISENFGQESNFEISDPFEGTPIGWDVCCGVSRTTDAYSGDYAIVVPNFYYYSQGFAHLSEFNKKIRVEKNITNIKGMYKFYGEDSNTAHACFIGYYTSSDSSEIVIDTIKNELVYTESYSQFDIKIENLLTLDSFQLFFESPIDSNGCNNDYYYCNLLILDDVSFDFANTVGTSQIPSLNESILVYPNPSSEWVTITNPTSNSKILSLWDFSGMPMSRLNLRSFESLKIDISFLNAGTYIILDEKLNQSLKILLIP